MKEINHMKTPGGAGPFAILWAAGSGRLAGNPSLKREMGFFLLLQVFGIGLAVLSGWLGYSRALTFFSGLENPALAAIVATVFVAASAFFFVNHVSARLAFRAQGGIFAPGQMLALVVSSLLAGGVIALDFQMNKSGVAPASESITQQAATSQAGQIVSTYDAQISEARADLVRHEKGFTWKGQVWVPARGKSTKWHSADKVAGYYAAQDRLQQLLDAKATALANDGNVVARDSQRYTEEVSSKQDVLNMVVGLMYVLMFLSTFRAALYANLVMDYLDANPYGDIPGTQEDRYGDRQEQEPPTKEHSASPAGYPRPGEHVQGKETNTYTIGYRTSAAPVARQDAPPETRRVSEPTRRVEGKGFPYSCTQCGEEYFAKRPILETEKPFCCAAHRAAWHKANPKKKEI